MRHIPDVAVIGGGIAGCAAAYYLTRLGAQVTLFEKDSVASHASGFAFGGILTRWDLDSGDPLSGLSALSDRLHGELSRELAAESGVDPQYVRKPAVFLALTEREAASYRSTYRALAAQANAGRSDARWLGHGELSHIEARISDRVLGGLYAGGALEVEPYKLTLGLWQSAERRGAKLVNREVTGITLSGHRAIGVEAGGDRHAAGAVVIANGPWAAEAGRWLGVPIPVTPLKGQILRLDAPGPAIEVSLWWGGDYVSSKPDGLVWAGTTEEHAGFDESPTPAARDRITKSLVSVLPYLAGAKLVKQTACLRPLSADRLPIIGPVPGVEGVFVATGAGRNGIELGPGIGRTAAQLAAGERPEADVSRLTLDRLLLPPGPSM
jgi:glycine oxidase